MRDIRDQGSIFLNVNSVNMIPIHCQSLARPNEKLTTVILFAIFKTTLQKRIQFVRYFTDILYTLLSLRSNYSPANRYEAQVRIKNAIFNTFLTAWTVTSIGTVHLQLVVVFCSVICCTNTNNKKFGCGSLH